MMLVVIADEESGGWPDGFGEKEIGDERESWVRRCCLLIVVVVAKLGEVDWWW
jgi:hypothetical protein